jgi:hypothetical protein
LRRLLELRVPPTRCYARFEARDAGGYSATDPRGASVSARCFTLATDPGWPPGRHSVARIIFHGNRGELRQPYREGQEDQLGALGFALNALVLWNAQYLDDAIVHLRATGHDIPDEDLQRVSPLQHEHIRMLGNFPFTLPHDLAAGQRRQLRGLGEPA